MKKITITSLAFAMVFAAAAQEVPPPIIPKPPVESKQMPLPPEAPQLPATPEVPTLPDDLVNTVPAAPEAALIDEETPDSYQLFLKKNPSVRSLAWNKTSLIVRLKSGKEEKYKLSDEESMKQAEEKYGDIPEPPPPPPPPPMAPPPPPAPPKSKKN